MREELTGDDLFAEILMLGDQGRCVVLVEGPDDMDALDAHIMEDSAYLIPGYGKTSVQYAIGLCDSRGVTYTLAILDRDWIGLGDAAEKSPNIVYTDMYDLDATVIFSGEVCKRVVSSFGDIQTVKQHLRSAAVDHAFDLAVPSSAAIGVLRLMTKEQRLPFKVRDFPVGQIINFETGLVDFERLITIANAKAIKGSQDFDRAQVMVELKDRISKVSDLKRYCSGHDLVVALASIMRSRWNGAVKSADLAKALRAAFSCPDLSKTTLYREVQDWALRRSVDIWSCPAVGAPIPAT